VTTEAIGDGLSVAVQVHEDLVLVALAGELDFYTVPGFRRGADPHASAGDQIVIDLAEVTLIDSAGLAALIGLRNEAERSGPGRLGLVCPHRPVLKLLEITGLEGAFSVGPDLRAVRAALVK